jgi:hypothetical protein
MRRLFPIITAVVLGLSLSACSLSKKLGQHHREHSYRARLARVSFPTTRAKLYAALPPASAATMARVGRQTIPGSESYPLDAHVRVQMRVSYAHMPDWFKRLHLAPNDDPGYPYFVPPLETDAMVSEYQAYVRSIRPSPDDTVLSATLVDNPPATTLPSKP